MPDAFDEKALMEGIEGDVEFLQEALDMFDEDAPALLAQLRAAAESGDAAALVRPAHALKGLVGNFCAEPAETSAHDLEIMGREGQLADVQAAVETLEREVQRLKEQLCQFVKMKAE